MKVVFVIDSIQTGGTERSILEILRRLPEMSSVVVYFEPKADLRLAYDEAGVKTVLLSAKPLAWRLLPAIKLYRYLTSVRPDLVVANLFWSEFYARITCWLLGIPIVGTFVNDPYSPHRQASLTKKGRIKLGLYKLLDQITAKVCVHFISNSVAIKHSNVKALQIDSSKVSVIHRGRNVAKFPKREEQSSAARTGTFVIINVSRQIKRKGQLDLIRAFASFREEVPNSELQLVGDGDFRVYLETEVRSLSLEGQVTFLGTRSDIPELLAAADVFVLPSYYEGFSGALIEAMMAGIPIVCSDISMNLEVLGRPNYASIYRLGAIQELKESLLEVYHQRAKAINRARIARDFAHETYDIKAIARKWQQQLEALIDL